MRTFAVLRLILVLAAVLVLASPVAAEGRAVVGEGSKTGQAPKVCLNVGTALAVLTPATAIAEIIPAAVPAGSPTPRVLVVLEPSNVGACADFQGFWVGTVKGTAEATLTLYRVTDPGGPLGEEVSHQTIDETREGPSLLSQKMAAALKIEQVGRQHFAAVLQVSAQPDGGTPVRAEELRVDFDVEYRVPKKPGSITGCVYKDGTTQGIAGAHVVANPAGSRLVGLVAVDAAVKPSGEEGGSRGAKTGDNGCYTIEAAPGRYVVHVEAAGYKPQWFDRKDKAADADVVEVLEATARDHVDFYLVARPVEPPARKVFIRGFVYQADGTAPISHAYVRGWVAPTPPGGHPGEDGPGTWTNAEGKYELQVPPGTWLVTASAETYVAEWWRETPTAETAEVIDLPNVGDVKEGVNFTLAAKSRITGRVTGPHAPLKDAVVTAYVKTNALAGETPTRVTAKTGADGRYVLFVSPGKWLVQATAETYIGEWWNNKTEVDADVIDVAEGQTVSDIDFALTPKARLSGTVLGPTSPLKGATVTAYRKTGLLGETAHFAVKTGEDGTFVLYLPAGKWIVGAAAEWFTTEFYNGKTADGNADEIVLAEGDQRGDVNFSLDPVPHGFVTGKVVAPDGTSIVKAMVMAIRFPLAPGMTIQGPRVYTNEKGEYRLAVAPGEYAIGAARQVTRESEQPTWLWYNGKAHLEDADRQPLGDGVTLADINFELP